MGNIFPERLAEAIKPLKQGEFAEKIGIGRTQFNRYATGKRPPPAEILAKVSRESGRSVDWLLGLDAEMTPYAHTALTGDDLTARLVRAGEEQMAALLAPRSPIFEKDAPDVPKSAIMGAISQLLDTVAAQAKPAPAPPVSRVPFREIPLVDSRIAAGLGIFAEDQLDPDDPYVLVPENAVRGRADLVAIRIEGKSMEPVLADGSIVCIDRGDKVVTEKGIFAVRLDDGSSTVKRIQMADERTMVLVSENKEMPLIMANLGEGETSRDRIVGRVVWSWRSFV